MYIGCFCWVATCSIPYFGYVNILTTLTAYVHKSIPTTRLYNLEEPDKGVIWLQLKPARTPRPFSGTLLVGVYYPPGQAAEAEKGMLDYLSHGLDLFLRDHPA